MDEQKKMTSRFFDFFKSSGRVLSVATAGAILIIVGWSACCGDKKNSTPQTEANKPMNKNNPATAKLPPISSPQQNQETVSASPVIAKASAADRIEAPSQWQLFDTSGEKGTTSHISRTASSDVQYDDYPLGDLQNPQIVVEKSKLRLTVFEGRSAVKRYRAAVGGGRGDKTREGDLCTPEGVFYVCVRNTQSKYVLSLGLSYPNIEDARRGLRAGLISQIEYDRIALAINRGQQPPWNTKLGGEIMIHGQRKGGRDTKGCIALEDNDIRELFPKIPNGTKVTILP